MKRKELVKNISSVLSSEETSNKALIDELGGELYTQIFKLNFIHLLVYIPFLIISILMFHKIDNLSFVSEDFYIPFVTLLVIFTVVCAIVFFTLYIYNKSKNELISENGLKNAYNFYQIYDILSFIGLFLTVFLWIVLFVVTPVEVSGTSMEKTYYEGDKVLVWHMGYEPKRFDVVIVDAENYYTSRDTEFVIKRVVAVGGDKVEYSMDDGIVKVAGRIVARNIDYSVYQRMMYDVANDKAYHADGIVPEGYCVVLGDNLSVSEDSRTVGLIANEDILGKCFFRIYPFNQIGIPVRK